MQYGYFDDQAKEYVITRPDTPQSWSNYLGSTEFGGIITNNAGGYGFYRSAAKGRFLRLRFNSIPMDQPGRYFYIRDGQSGDFWSTSWQPVAKPLEQYSSSCRHGTAYTSISSCYDEILSESTYFIPLGETFEYWRLKITNQSDRERDLSIFTYCEFTNQWDTRQDQVNLQYSLFIVKGEMTGDGLLRIAIQDNLSSASDEEQGSDIADHAWMGMAGAEITAYDTSRESFLGTYGGYHEPHAVDQGRCSNSCAYGDNACGSLQADLSLKPGQSREVLVLLGIGEANGIGRSKFREFGSLERAKAELQKLKDSWHAKLSSLVVNTPDADFDHMINTWGLYNSLVTFNWSRSASLVYNGERDGLGFRDSVQDVLGVVSAIPQEARQRLELMLTGQLSNGGAIPVIKHFDHHPGSEAVPDPAELRSDDCLWFFNAIPSYVNESGDIDFYSKVLPYADMGQGSVFDHLRRALEFNLQRTGRNGLPCGLSADWNDCLRLGYQGESLFVAFQVRLGLTTLAGIAEQLGRTEDVQWCLRSRQALDERIAACAWDGGWFIWAIDEHGKVYGTKDYAEGQIYLNTQVWAVLSGAASADQAERCMCSVREKLATPFGLMLCAPPFQKTSVEVMRAVVYNPGIKENAGIFNHTQGWGIMAECLLGHGDQAYAYCRAAMPSAYNDRAEIRQAEPYVQAQTTYAPYSPRAGNTRTSWLTGAAAWFYFSSTQYILGIRPEAGGLRIDPCIPSDWDGFSARRTWRGCQVQLTLYNPAHVCCGVNRMILNGRLLPGSLVPVEDLEPENVLEVWLGEN